VLGLKVVLADGSLLKTGRRTVKGVAGYELTKLFIGSEGTLGVITEAMVALKPLPQAPGALVMACGFGRGVDPVAEAGLAWSGGARCWDRRLRRLCDHRPLARARSRAWLPLKVFWSIGSLLYCQKV